jgi:hypothetical protein
VRYTGTHAHARANTHTHKHTHKHTRARGKQVHTCAHVRTHTSTHAHAHIRAYTDMARTHAYAHIRARAVSIPHAQSAHRQSANTDKAHLHHTRPSLHSFREHLHLVVVAGPAHLVAHAPFHAIPIIRAIKAKRCMALDTLIGEEMQL